MSDRPLFQNADEQERAYAPQQRPEGDAQAMVQADDGLGAGGAAGDDAQGAISGGGAGGAMPIPGPGASGMLQGTAGDVSGTTAYGASPANLDDDDTRS